MYICYLVHKHTLVGRMLPWGLLGLTAVQYSLSYMLSCAGAGNRQQCGPRAFQMDS
jgi:hypothetical protein